MAARTEVKQYKNLQYVIRYPENFDDTKKYPTILVLHGAGSRGNDINIIKNFVFLKQMPADVPFIVILPQCFADTWFAIFEQLVDFTGAMRTLDCVDTDRFYLTGNSMGGYATWQLAMTKPEWFAAIVPICGGGMYWNADRLKNVPVWAFHGTLDEVVHIYESIDMVNAVNRSGGNAKLTVYDHAAHDSWTETYANPEIYRWLLTHSKESKME
jgi:predicted peptidase